MTETSGSIDRLKQHPILEDIAEALSSGQPFTVANEHSTAGDEAIHDISHIVGGYDNFSAMIKQLAKMRNLDPNNIQISATFNLMKNAATPASKQQERRPIQTQQTPNRLTQFPSLSDVVYGLHNGTNPTLDSSDIGGLSTVMGADNLRALQMKIAKNLDKILPDGITVNPNDIGISVTFNLANENPRNEPEYLEEEIGPIFLQKNSRADVLKRIRKAQGRIKVSQREKRESKTTKDIADSETNETEFIRDPVREIKLSPHKRILFNKVRRNPRPRLKDILGNNQDDSTEKTPPSINESPLVEPTITETEVRVNETEVPEGETKILQLLNTLIDEINTKLGVNFKDNDKTILINAVTEGFKSWNKFYANEPLRDTQKQSELFYAIKVQIQRAIKSEEDLPFKGFVTIANVLSNRYFDVKYALNQVDEKTLKAWLVTEAPVIAKEKDTLTPKEHWNAMLSGCKATFAQFKEFTLSRYFAEIEKVKANFKAFIETNFPKKYAELPVDQTEETPVEEDNNGEETPVTYKKELIIETAVNEKLTPEMFAYGLSTDTLTLPQIIAYALQRQNKSTTEAYRQLGTITQLDIEGSFRDSQPHVNTRINEGLDMLGTEYQFTDKASAFLALIKLDALTKKILRELPITPSNFIMPEKVAQDNACREIINALVSLREKLKKPLMVKLGKDAFDAALQYFSDEDAQLVASEETKAKIKAALIKRGIIVDSVALYKKQFEDAQGNTSTVDTVPAATNGQDKIYPNLKAEIETREQGEKARQFELTYWFPRIPGFQIIFDKLDPATRAEIQKRFKENLKKGAEAIGRAQAAGFGTELEDSRKLGTPEKFNITPEIVIATILKIINEIMALDANRARELGKKLSRDVKALSDFLTRTIQDKAEITSGLVYEILYELQQLSLKPTVESIKADIKNRLAKIKERFKLTPDQTNDVADVIADTQEPLDIVPKLRRKGIPWLTIVGLVSLLPFLSGDAETKPKKAIPEDFSPKPTTVTPFEDFLDTSADLRQQPPRTPVDRGPYRPEKPQPTADEQQGIATPRENAEALQRRLEKLRNPQFLPVNGTIEGLAEKYVSAIAFNHSPEQIQRATQIIWQKALADMGMTDTDARKLQPGPIDIEFATVDEVRRLLEYSGGTGNTVADARLQQAFEVMNNLTSTPEERQFAFDLIQALIREPHPNHGGISNDEQGSTEERSVVTETSDKIQILSSTVDNVTINGRSYLKFISYDSPTRTLHIVLAPADAVFNQWGEIVTYKYLVSLPNWYIEFPRGTIRTRGQYLATGNRTVWAPTRLTVNILP